MCVLGAIDESYEAHYNSHIYDSICLKVSVNYGQPVKVIFFVFVHKTEWVNMIYRSLNLEGHQNCTIFSKVTTILTPFFQKNLKLQT